MRKIIYIFISIMTLMAVSCVYPYEVELEDGSSGTVVIEGDILCGEVSMFKIALTKSVSDTISSWFAVHELYVEGENGEKHYGRDLFKTGYYEVDTRNLKKDVKYRFVAKISKDVQSISYARTYSTDFMPVLVTPPIDSISYQVSPDSTSVSIKVTSHDDTQPEGYYRWDYVEDWEFTSSHMATHEYDYYSNSIREIDFMNENRYYCWGNNVSEDVLLYSTEDVGANFAPLVTLSNIPCTDRRVQRLYCITVKQYYISKESFRFWDVIRKNENHSGSIFAPQPSKPRGNIVCEENRDEYVIGSVSCCTVSTMRKFITGEEFGIYKDPFVCNPRSLDMGQWQTAYMDGYDVVTVLEGTPPYLWAKKGCVDCRLYGSKAKPIFWPTNNK